MLLCPPLALISILEALVALVKFEIVGQLQIPTHEFALCIENTNYEASSLILGKVYWILSDSKATKDDLVRIVDESGEDYLYPQESHFVFVDFRIP